MHAVIRKRQGLPWEPEVSKGLSKNSTHLTNVAAIPNFQPLAEDELTVAHGWLAHPKLVREITSHLLTLQQKALSKMLEMMAAPRHIASFLLAGCVPALNVACKGDDAEVRRLATVTLGRLAREDAGRKEMIAKKSIPALVERAGDSDADVRCAAFEAVASLVVTLEGLTACHEGGFIKVTVDRCTAAGGESEPSVQLAALGALHQLCKNDPGAGAAIECGAIEMCIQVLEHGTEGMREQAAFCLTTLTVEQEKKKMAMEQSVMIALIMLLHPSKPLAVKTAAACALMTMCNGTRMSDGSNACKVTAIKEGAIDALVPLLQEGLQHELAKTMTHETSALTVYVTKCIAALSDSPIGRKQLQAALGDLEALAQSDEPLVKKHATIAVQRVKWSP